LLIRPLILALDGLVKLPLKLPPSVAEAVLPSDVVTVIVRVFVSVFITVETVNPLPEVFVLVCCGILLFYFPYFVFTI
jgi:hypothetical protein